MIVVIVKMWEGTGKIETFPIFLIRRRDRGRISTISSAHLSEKSGTFEKQWNRRSSRIFPKKDKRHRAHNSANSQQAEQVKVPSLDDRDVPLSSNSSYLSRQGQERHRQTDFFGGVIYRVQKEDLKNNHRAMHYISDWSELLLTKQIMHLKIFAVFNQILWPSAILVPRQIIFRSKYKLLNFRSLSGFVITKLIKREGLFWSHTKLCSVLKRLFSGNSHGSELLGKANENEAINNTADYDAR